MTSKRFYLDLGLEGQDPRYYLKLVFITNQLHHVFFCGFTTPPWLSGSLEKVRNPLDPSIAAQEPIHWAISTKTGKLDIEGYTKSVENWRELVAQHSTFTYIVPYTIPHGKEQFAIDKAIEEEFVYIGHRNMETFIKEHNLKLPPIL